MPETFRWQLTEDESQQVLFTANAEMDIRKGVGAFSGLEFLHVKAKKIINEVPGGSQMPFRFTINPYRGCSHACVYCFARPTHEYLNLNRAEDFDTKIVVKVNAVERLRAELRSPKWRGEGIAMGTNTDPYQRAEGKYQLTRGIIGELSHAGNPFSILTKSTLVLRDTELLVEAAKTTDVQVNLSIPTLDVDVWRSTEPGTPHPKQRVAALRKLTDAGLQTGVLVAPLLPGISDSEVQLKAVIDAVVDAGAGWVATSPLHLKRGVKEHWMQWLADKHPGLVDTYEAMYRDRAYLPAAQRRELTRRSQDLIGRTGHGPSRRSPFRRNGRRSPTGGGAVVASDPRNDEIQQLSLHDE